MGWCSGFFGIIIKSERDSIHSIPLNIIGVLFAIISLIISIKIESNVDSNQSHSDNQDELLL
jgi:hypothetical protein